MGPYVLDRSFPAENCRSAHLGSASPKANGTTLASALREGRSPPGTSENLFVLQAALRYVEHGLRVTCANTSRLVAD